MSSPISGSIEGLGPALEQRALMAAQVAKVVPGHEEATFNIVLEALLVDMFASDRSIGRHGGEKPSSHMDPGQRRTTKRAEVAGSTRLSPLMEANAEAVGAAAQWLSNLSLRHKVYGVLRWARDEFGVEAMTQPEIRAVLTKKFRIGMPSPSLRSVCSRAPITELGRDNVGTGLTQFRLMQAGEAALEAAIEKHSKSAD